MDYRQYQPKTLFSQCVNFITDNIDHVESFVGFPSQIGQILFRAITETAQFHEDASTSSKALSLFAEAFNEDILSSLDISGQHLALNYHLEQIFLFTSLIALDVSNCGLGDQHEILTHHFSQLYKLKTLVMKNNALSNAGIQKMTTPYRMFGRGPSCLTHVDLTSNPDITASCLKYLTPFSQLSAVLLTNCKVEILGDWKIKRKTDQRAIAVQTVGWASSVICSWVNQSQAKIRQRPTKHKRESWFYSRTSKILHNTDGNQKFDKSFHDSGDTFIAERCGKNNNEQAFINPSCGDTLVRCNKTVSECKKGVKRASSENNSRFEMEKFVDLYRSNKDPADISADISLEGRNYGRTWTSSEEEYRGISVRQSAGQSQNSLQKYDRFGNDLSCGRFKVFNSSSIDKSCREAMGKKFTLLGKPKLQSKQCANKDANVNSGNCTVIDSKRSLMGGYCSMLLASKPVNRDKIQTKCIPCDKDSNETRHGNVSIDVNNAESSKCRKRRKIVIHKHPWSSKDLGCS